MKGITGFLYRLIIKPILFLFPADDVHAHFLAMGRRLGKYRFFRNVIKFLWRYDSPTLEQSVCGLNFKNPVGLSAGFDYDADLVNILPSIGFGFHTVGTLTAEAYRGNPGPMLGRLPKSRALLVNKGFKNESVASVLARVPKLDGRATRGVSIGVTNKAYENYEEMIDNLLAGFRDAKLCADFDFYELNISCPNLRNIKSLTDKFVSPFGLGEILGKLATIGIDRPLFIKMPLEHSQEDFFSMIEAIVPYSFVKGLIFSNLAKDRTNSAFDSCEIAKAGVGNFSGKPLENKSNELLRLVYKKYKDRFVLIGVGGIFNAEDAYKKIRYGATLVQMITGMVYRGPQVIGEINEGLSKLLARDGYKNISEAIGVDAYLE